MIPPFWWVKPVIFTRTARKMTWSVLSWFSRRLGHRRSGAVEWPSRHGDLARQWWFRPKWGSNEPGNGDSADQNGDLTDSFFRPKMGISALVIQHDPHKKGWFKRLNHELQGSTWDLQIPAQAGDRPGAKGTARVYRPSQPWHRHSPHLRPNDGDSMGISHGSYQGYLIL